MAISTEINARWVELQNMGYNLKEKDGYAPISLYFKEAYITDFNQTNVTIEEIIQEAEIHHREISGDNECSEDATVNGCEDYNDKCTKYQVAPTKEA